MATVPTSVDSPMLQARPEKMVEACQDRALRLGGEAFAEGGIHIEGAGIARRICGRAHRNSGRTRALREKMIP